MKDILRNTDLFVFDLDGTLYYGGKQIPGAELLIARLRERGISMRFVTNTDSMSIHQVEERIRRHGLEALPGETFTPWVAVRNFLAQQPGRSCFCLATEPVLAEMHDLPWNETEPDYLVVGSFNERVSFPLLNQAFRCLRRGARLLTTSTAGWYLGSDGQAYVDTGAFAALLEYAANTKAECLGKPCPEFFSLAMASANATPHRTTVVGDDLDADIAGARSIGAHAILVKTGKYTDEWFARAKVRPDHVAESVAELAAALAES